MYIHTSPSGDNFCGVPRGGCQNGALAPLKYLPTNSHDTVRSEKKLHPVLGKNWARSFRVLEPTANYLVMDWVHDIGFMGTRKQLINGLKSKWNKAFLHFLPNFWHIW